MRRAASAACCRPSPREMSVDSMVGAPRFELGTPSPPDWCANRAALRSVPFSRWFVVRPAARRKWAAIAPGRADPGRSPSARRPGGKRWSASPSAACHDGRRPSLNQLGAVSPKSISRPRATARPNHGYRVGTSHPSLARRTANTFPVVDLARASIHSRRAGGVARRVWHILLFFADRCRQI